MQSHSGAELYFVAVPTHIHDMGPKIDTEDTRFLSYSIDVNPALRIWIHGSRFQ